MDARNATLQYHLVQWLPIIKKYCKSGVSVRSCCLKTKVNEKQFYYWKRKLREVAIESLLTVA